MALYRAGTSEMALYVKQFFPNLTGDQLDRAALLLQPTNYTGHRYDLAETDDFRALEAVYQSYLANGYSAVEAAVRALADECEANGEDIDVSFTTGRNALYKPAVATNWKRVAIVGAILLLILKR